MLPQTFLNHSSLQVEPFGTYYVYLLTENDSEEELEQLVDLVNTCYRSTQCWTNEASLIQGKRITLEQLKEYVKTSEMLILRADLSNPSVTGPILLGCVRTGPVENTEVGLLCSHPSSQGKGVGSFLIAAAEERCQKVHHFTTMVMNVLDARTELLKWYERKGYCLTESRIPARPFIEQKGEHMLQDCNFVLLKKLLDKAD
eukprot:jgi/Galph1/5864/GphlegSOOS_G4488.1